MTCARCSALSVSPPGGAISSIGAAREAVRTFQRVPRAPGRPKAIASLGVSSLRNTTRPSRAALHSSSASTTWT
jgi:hypothetical protein